MPLPFPPATTNLRDTSDAISPTWLNGPVGQKWRYSMSVMYDAICDGAAYAVRSRFPSLAPADAFTWLSADRQIDQGFQEPNSTFAQRLIQWLDLWRFAGSPTGILLAMLGYVIPDAIQVRLVDNRGQWYTYAAAANPMPAGATYPIPPTRVAPNGNWHWDFLSDPFGSTYWWRAWIILYPDTGLFPAPTATCGGGSLCGPSPVGSGIYCNWRGSSASLAATQARAFGALAKKWKPAHCWIPYVIVAYNAADFDPAAAFGSAHLPDGNYGHNGKPITSATYTREYVPARTTQQASYLPGAL